MKKTFIILAAVANLATQAQTNEQEASKRNFFYVSPIDLFMNTLELGYERTFADQNSIAVLGGIKLSKKDDYFARLGGVGEIQYRINLHYTKQAPRTISKSFSTHAYFAPFASYRYEQITDPYQVDAGLSIQTVTIVNSGFSGVGFGFRFMSYASRFCMNLFAGGGVKYSSLSGDKKYADFFQVGYTGIAPKLSFQMGLAF